VHLQPSIQKIVLALATDCLSHLSEESVNTDAYACDVGDVARAVRALADEVGPNTVDGALRAEALQKAEARTAKRQRQYNELIEAVIKIATAPTTHVRLRLCPLSVTEC
jgi:proteasome activator subunit 4